MEMQRHFVLIKQHPTRRCGPIHRINQSNNMREQRLAEEVRNMDASYHAKMQLSSGSANK